MASAGVNDRAARSLGRQWPGFAAGTLVVMGLLAGAALWLRASEGEDPRSVTLGSVREFPEGSVTFLEIDNAYFDHLPLEGPDGRRPPGAPHTVDGVRVYVINGGDAVRVFLARSPWLGCRLVADSDTVRGFARIYDADPSEAVVADPCHGAVFAADGAHLGGPGIRGLDSFPVSYQPNGDVTIDLTDLHGGSDEGGP